MTAALDVARQAVTLWRQVHGNESLYLQCQRFDGYYWQWAYQGNESGIITYPTAKAAALASPIFTSDPNHPGIEPGDLLYWEWGTEWHVGTALGREGGRTIITHTGSKGSNFMDLGNHVFVAHADTMGLKFYGASHSNGRNRRRSGLTAYGAAGPLAAGQRRAIATARRRADATAQSEHVGGGTTDLLKGAIANFVGWKRGENVEGNDVWFKGTSGAWFWSGGFEGGPDTTGLPDLNAPAMGTRERRTTAVLIGRAEPSSKAAQVEEPLDPGTIGTFDGWTNGENIDGEDRWVHGAFSDRWFSLRYLEPRNVDGLPKIEVKPAPGPAPTPAPTPAKPVLDPAAPWKSKTPDSAIAKWIGSPNYNYRAARAKDHITLHWMAGYLAGTDAEFQKPGTIVNGRGTNQSTHYGVGLTEVHQYVSEADYAHSDGDADSNATGISIEHEGGYILNGVRVDPPRAVLDNSAALMADIAYRHGWKRLEWMVNVFPHNHFVATTCPGTLDYGYLIAAANALLAAMGPKPEPEPEPEPEPAPVPVPEAPQESVSVPRESLRGIRDALSRLLGDL